MYELTLTREERKAIAWVGNRYGHGHDLCSILVDCPIKGCKEGDADKTAWGSEETITYIIPENRAWGIKDIGEEDDFLWTCFCDELTQKMNDFCNKIA